MAAFRGEVIHSSEYRNPAPYSNKRVLVVGFGNSGGEIALDLANAGVDVTLSVRGPVQILPRDLLGLPILTWAIAQRHLSAGVADFINAPMIRLAVGSIEKLGLRRATKGPRRMIEEDGRVPLLDIGTVAKIRDGTIKVRGGIERFTADGVEFSKSGAENFDCVILATGFRADLRKLLSDVEGVLDGQGKPLVTGQPTAGPGLYFCGQIASATGQLRAVGLEAQRIAELAKNLIESGVRKSRDCSRVLSDRDLVDPRRYRIANLGHDIRILAARAREHMEGMIASFNHMQRRLPSETFDDRFEQVQFSKRIAGALQEQHRNPDVGEMRSAVGRGFSCRMQRKTQKRESANARQWCNRLCLRGHAGTEGFAARDQRHFRTAPSGFGDCGTNGGMGDGRRIRPLAPFLHVGKLIAQGCDLAFGETGRDCLHKGMRHSGAGAMGNHKTRTCARRPDQQARDGVGVPDFDRDLFGLHGFHAP